MSMTGLDVFDTTVSKTNNWLNELMQCFASQDKRKAYRALRATLHALRDRLTVDEVAQLAAQFPMLIRGFYYEGWDPAAKPAKVRHVNEFLEQITQELLPDYTLDSEEAARAVFLLLSQRVADGEIEDILNVIPKELRTLWPQPAAIP